MLSRHLATQCLSAAASILAAACHGTVNSTPPSIWNSLDASEAYTCGLSATGEALCWGGVAGYYEPAPLADSLMPISALPLRVPGERRFVTVSVGGLSMCALDSERRAFCWGANQYGELGDDSYLAKRGPSAVLGGHRWRTISAGGVHVCGITLEGAAYCWGNQFRGALGNGETSYGGISTPVIVQGGLAFDSIYAGLGTSCGLAPSGDAYCWGINDYGILGDGEPPEPGPETATPSLVVGGHRFASLALGGDHACGVTDEGSAYCWGWNAHGQLGDGGTEHSSSPRLVIGGLRWASLSVGYAHTCGLTIAGSGYCWGNNERGQFGTGVTGKADAPELIAAAGKYVTITAGGNHTCGLTPAGTAFCWGQGDYGQLGDGVMRDRSRPTQVAGY